MTWSRVIVYVDDATHELLDVEGRAEDDDLFAPDPQTYRHHLEQHPTFAESDLVEAFVEAWQDDPSLGTYREIEGVQASGWIETSCEGSPCVKNMLFAHKV